MSFYEFQTAGYLSAIGYLPINIALDRLFCLSDNRIMTNYISLKEAAKYCPYSQDYLKLRARQGKLKAIKMGRNWFTTITWLEEYKGNKETPGRRKKGSEAVALLPSKPPVKEWLVLFLVLFLIIVGVFLFLNLSLPLLEKIIPAKVYWIP